jgi:HlyD family secretion protein
VSGYVLRVVTESENIVAAGTVLVEIGDPRNLEIQADFLSTDAVRIQKGAEAIIENWGGKPLHARVRRVEPVGFTKVSALGVEEQRVIVRLDFTDPPEAWSGLGHDYRVFVRVVVAQDDNALLVPLSALFRSGEQWAVFKVVNGVARMTVVELGERNLDQAAVLSGLNQRDVLIIYPNDRIVEGIRITERQLMH